jgi:ppGpp synthetase/RelA/SpoT-type nucleotidyltranferase
MRVPKSVRELHAELLPIYTQLKETVDLRIRSLISSRWHYESRVKEEVSFAQKLETGRERKPRSPEDMFGATIVVENHERIKDAEELVRANFSVTNRRPRDPRSTHLRPQHFDFDDLRLYVTLPTEPGSKPTIFKDALFEIQIKTFLQHAWGIATHDLIYKSTDIDWSSARVAFQVKAMLENAEVSISQARKSADAPALNRSNPESDLQIQAMKELRERWEASMLPQDIRRLAMNLCELKENLGFDSLSEIWTIVDEATRKGRGAKLLTLSPFGAITEAIVHSLGSKLFDRSKGGKWAIFIPPEIEVPLIPASHAARVVGIE